MKLSRLAQTFVALACIGTAAGCSTGEIPQGHRGRMFDMTGALAFWVGGRGFTGPVLGPGSYFTGIYDELRTVQCTQQTNRETLHSLTKDGVQFALDVYIRYNADCSNTSVKQLLEKVMANEKGVVTSDSLYGQFIRPKIGEATREVISPYPANDVNTFREQIVADVRTRFLAMLRPDAKHPAFVQVQEVNLSNLDFPDDMDHANTERAVQAIKRDTAIAERGRVEAETTTARMRVDLNEQRGRSEAVYIDQIGAALRRNPEYLTYQLQGAMPGMYERAGAQGNLVITAPSPTVMVMPRGAPAPR